MPSCCAKDVPYTQAMRSAPLFACLALIACNRAPPPAPPPPQLPPGTPTLPVEWTALSADTTAEIRQLTVGPGACTVEGVVNGAVTWSVDECLSTPKMIHFVSPDGDRLMVIDPLPEFAGNAGSAIAVSAYEQGNLRQTTSVSMLVRDSTKLRATARYVRWAKGTNDIAGVPPAFSNEGTTVRLETVDGQQHDLLFEGRAPPVVQAGGTMKTMFVYGSADNEQFAQTLADVPKKFRGKAKKVQLRMLANTGVPRQDCKRDPKNPTMLICP